MTKIGGFLFEPKSDLTTVLGRIWVKIVGARVRTNKQTNESPRPVAHSATTWPNVVKQFVNDLDLEYALVSTKVTHNAKFECVKKS